jgi:capsular polysaccharide biosynthesis protein
MHTIRFGFVWGVFVYRWPFFPIRKVIRQNLDLINYFKVSLLNLKRLPWRVGYIHKEHLWVFDDWSETYFHWTFDVLVKLQALKAKSLCTQIAIPASLLKNKYVEESLSHLGYQLTPLKSNTLYFFRSLLTQQNVEYFSPQLLHKLRSTLFPKIGLPQEKVRIYISRRKANRRMLNNEDLLTDQLLSHGFNVVCLEDLSWRQQVLLFQQAEMVVGMHGAGLSNILYCTRPRLVIELVPSVASNKLFQVLASLLEYPYYSVLLDKKNLDPHASMLTIDSQSISEVITYIKSIPAGGK